MRGAKLALALADGRALVEHVLGEGSVVGGKARNGALEVLRDHAVEFQQLRLACLGEAPALVELLAGQLHEVLVHDVADVLEVADEGDERDLLPGEIGGHGLLPEAGEEELDLPLEVVELVIAPLDILQQLLVVRAQDGHGIPQHTLRHVAHAERFARGLPEGEGGLVEVAIVEVARLEGIVVALLISGHERGDGPRGRRGEGQEYRADGHVEEGVRVGDLARRVLGGGGQTAT